MRSTAASRALLAAGILLATACGTPIRVTTLHSTRARETGACR